METRITVAWLLALSSNHVHLIWKEKHTKIVNNKCHWDLVRMKKGRQYALKSIQSYHTQPYWLIWMCRYLIKQLKRHRLRAIARKNAVASHTRIRFIRIRADWIQQRNESIRPNPIWSKIRLYVRVFAEKLENCITLVGRFKRPATHSFVQIDGD